LKTSPKSIDCAAKLAVLADPTRLAVVEILLGGPRNVTEINRRIGIAQNLLSHHLRILRHAGIVISARAGKGARYTLAPGVELGASHKALNLGCCSLTFEKVHFGKKAL
jgi:DNA-binding transcriptional ArsR family regulator